MKYSHIFSLVVSFSFIITACERFTLLDNNKSHCVAQFKNECLTINELNDVLKNTSQKDSQWIVDNYINEWKMTHILSEKAKKQSLISEDELQRQIHAFQTQLYASAYIQHYIKENLDTSITKEEIKNYYQTHIYSFKLTNNIIQVFYVKLNDNEKDINEFKNLLSRIDKDKNKLYTFIIEKATSYFIEDSLWLKWDDLTKEIPALKNYNVQNFSKGKVIEWKDGTYYYYIKIKNIKVKDEYSPIDYEIEKIKQLILNHRKNQLIQQLKSRVLIEAQNTH